MAKRKLTSEEALDDILNFVDGDDVDGDDIDEADVGDLHELIGDIDEEVSGDDLDSGEVDVNSYERPRGRVLTPKRLVNSIDASLDESNYDPLQLPKEAKSFLES
eukprot:Seg238.6 transcript_id=Seg238.6/GoldUCD/mRNA.D3Y31 product="hypothetical protein" protein_id=Seg238.6/GoldUCD/D3Y31